MVNAAMAQLVEHILGKDEVPGPNPGSSSRQPRSKCFGALVFYRLFANKDGDIFVFRGCLELLLSLRAVLSHAKRRKSGSHTPRRRVKLACKRQVRVSLPKANARVSTKQMLRGFGFL